MNYLSKIPKEELIGKTILLRTGLNIPLNSDGTLRDDFRIKKALPTIKYLRDHCKKLIIIAHLGRESDASLAPIAQELQRYLPDMHFANWSESLSDHQLVLMENVRQDSRETSLSEPERDTYAKEIIRESGADIFVQDAFSVLHRSHASITSIPTFLPSYAGLLVEQEVAQLSKALNPPSPSVCILGGAKFATKEPLIRKFLESYDKVFIGGAIANDFFKALGYEVGESLVHEGNVPDDILHNPKIVLPQEVIVIDSKNSNIIADTVTREIINPKNLASTMKIVDVLPPEDLLKNGGEEAAFIVWNGPLGYYEGGFIQGSEQLAHMIQRTQAQVVVGGGDTVATVGQQLSEAHLSTGGGALLTYLQKGTLIGLGVLE